MTLGRGDVEAQKNRGGGVYGHGGTDLVQGNTLQQGFHVLQATNGHPTFPTSPWAKGWSESYPIWVGQVEGHRQPGLALLQQVAKTLIGVGGGGVAGILPHGPHAPTVGVGLDTTGIGVLPGIAQIPLWFVPLGSQVLGSVQWVDLQSTIGEEFLPPLPKSLNNRLQRLFPPMFFYFCWA